MYALQLIQRGNPSTFTLICNYNKHSLNFVIHCIIKLMSKLVYFKTKFESTSLSLVFENNFNTLLYGNNNRITI